MEHEQIYPVLTEQQIIAYFRYVDDILIIYDQKKINIEHTLNKFNKLQPSINSLQKMNYMNLSVS
jgi:uncharacterized lipoprotein NlpE involved in copper resistance